MVAEFVVNRTKPVDKPVEASKSNPCPHCGKPDWCYSIGELTVCKRGSDPSEGWVRTTKTDKEGSFYYAPESPKKVPRPKSRAEYFYPDRNGNKLIRITRIDDGNGNKKIYQSYWDGRQWVNKVPNSVKARIPIYRYAEVQKAIASNQKIFLVEGEGVADALWKLGIPATTTIGGAGKYRSYGNNYKEDLSGASLVLCPDRDKPGIEYMEDIYKDFPNAQWLYAPPSTFVWNRLPSSGGLDIKDWIDEDKATKQQVLNAVQEQPSHQQQNKVVPHPSSADLYISTPELVKHIDQLIIDGIDGSQLEAEIPQLAAKSNRTSRDVRQLYQARLSELQQESDRADTLSEIENLLQLGETNLSLFNYLPHKLAYPLTQYAQWLNVKPETVLLGLLTTTSSLHDVGTELLIHKTQGFAVPPTVFGAMVAESGQKKSPITRQIVSKPLAVLKSEARHKYEAELREYQNELSDWEDKKASTPKGEKFTDPKPVEPKPPTIFYFTEANGEGIKQQAHNAPDKALFALVDELAGYFNSANSYRGGRGSDRQDMLSYYDGTGQTVLRSGGVKVDVPNIYLSIFGTIQPEVIRNIMRDSSDPDGQWARFLYVQQPLAAATLSDDDGSGVDITELLAGIYRRLHHTPARQYTLSRDAFKLYQPYYNELEKLRTTHPNPGMRATYSKAEGYTGRLALNLHVLHELSTNIHPPSTEIPEERMKEAIALMDFFIGQTRLLYSNFDEGIAPHITKLIEISKRRGWIKAKDVQLAYNTKHRPKPNVVRLWMREAEALGFGVTRGSGIRIEFNYQKVDGIRQKVDDLSTVENIDISTLQELGRQKVDKSRPKVDDLSTVENIDMSTFQDFSRQSRPKLDTPQPNHHDVGESKIVNPPQGNYQIEDPQTVNLPQNNYQVSEIEKVDIDRGERLPNLLNHHNPDTTSNTAVDTPSTNGLLSSTNGLPTSTFSTSVEFKVGDRISHSQQYHVRFNQVGIVEAMNECGYQVYWVEDGDNQRHPAHRTYGSSELKLME